MGLLNSIRNFLGFNTELAMAGQWWENLSSENKISLYNKYGGSKQ